MAQGARATAVFSLGRMPRRVGSGYVGDAVWSHGGWKGRKRSESATYDMTSPHVVGMLQDNVAYHVAQATCIDDVGRGPSSTPT